MALANDSRLRARRLGVDVGPRPGRADRARARGRDGVDQRPHVQPRRVPVLVGRGQGVGARPDPLEVRPVRVRQRQAPRVGALAIVRDPWWHPYDETLGRALRQHGHDPVRPAVDPARARCKRGLWPLLKLGAPDRRREPSGSALASGRAVSARALYRFADDPGSAFLGTRHRTGSDLSGRDRHRDLRRCPPRPTRARNASASSARGSATSRACAACSRRRSTSPACG